MVEVHCIRSGLDNSDLTIIRLQYIVREYVKNIKITFTFLHNMMYN